MAEEKKELINNKITKTKDGRTFIDKTEFEKEMVTGKFENKDAPGVSHRFAYGYNGTIEEHELFDGKEHTVPRYIARHINNCTYRDTEPVFNERGMVVDQKPVTRKRFNFFSEF